jgi:SAM-dependent methyltransferase
MLGVDVEDMQTPVDRYIRGSSKNSIPFLSWFHNSRIEDFEDFIDESGETALSIGCGRGILEKQIVKDKFAKVYGLDPSLRELDLIEDDNFHPILGVAPPIPFPNNSLDAVIVVGTTEHLPDECRFVKESKRCLKNNKSLFLTAPIEVGVGGLLRYLGKNILRPNRGDSPDGLKRFFDYSIQELLKNTPRDMHQQAHRYYNYTYLLNDLTDIFEEVNVIGWPVKLLGEVNFILFIKATKRK